jgi:hypothetical protein
MQQKRKWGTPLILWQPQVKEFAQNLNLPLDVQLLCIYGMQTKYPRVNTFRTSVIAALIFFDRWIIIN